QRLGLPSEVRRLVVFGDVLRGTLKENILTQATWTDVIKCLLAATVEFEDTHVIVKPWAGDSLPDVRAAAARIDDPRLHVLDPYASPLHNGELLAHAVTVVSSPTSFLGEFAAMGGLPILLSFPETHFYHGRKAHDLFTGFCHVVHNVEEVG